MPRARTWRNRVTIVCPACRDVEIARGYTDPADGGVAGEHTVPFEGSNPTLPEIPVVGRFGN